MFKLSKLLTLYHSVKYLKFSQLYYRAILCIKKRVVSKRIKLLSTREKARAVNFKRQFFTPESYIDHKTFQFLNQKKQFESKIDWNFRDFGMLWAYNLNYFDFLEQYNISKKQGLALINDYIDNLESLKVGLESYTVSLRAINWVKFLSREKISDERINQCLFGHYHLLVSNFEYHLLGNHVLENAFSVLLGAYYFQNDKFYKKAKRNLIRELNEQILTDGGHFELSPMYHQIIFFRLLDAIQLMTFNSWKHNEQFLSFLKDKAAKMWSWLRAITYSNGDIPMVNDASSGIALSSRSLNDFAESLKIERIDLPLKDSGYRIITTQKYELLIDVGNIGPDHQPGHAHSDTFNFELHLKRQPIIVDTGTSTYKNNKTRQQERSTKAHNTVEIADMEQTHVWSGFRVGRRAKITSLIENYDCIKATHDGYKKYGFEHTRAFCYDIDKVVIQDKVSKPTNNMAKAYFHFYSGIEVKIIDKDRVEFVLGSIEFEGAAHIEETQYNLVKGFYKTEKASCIIVTFDQNLKTSIRV